MPDKKTSIRKLGSVLDVDEEGYIVKAASNDKIQFKWPPAVDEVVEAYKQHLGDRLHSVYVRGSVARGEAIDDISDIDTVALITTSNNNIYLGWATDFERNLMKEFPFVNGTEIKAFQKDNLDPKTQFMLKNPGSLRLRGRYHRNIAENETRNRCREPRFFTGKENRPDR